MASGFHIHLDGFDDLLKIFQNAPEHIKEDFKVEIESAAKTIQKDAKDAAPVNYGTLRALIDVDPPSSDGLTQSVTSRAEYSAYVEFGTGTKVDVPGELEEYALQFKGSHEVPGMNARPFFFPAAFRESPQLITRLKRALQKSLQKT